jgi:predicted transposase YbfD/YdcC
MERFKKAFRRLPDPRADNARHELLDVLFIALAATLCGAEGPSDMATFGQSKEGLLRLVLQLQHGVPSHDTFSRVFRLLDPQAFEAAFRRFMAGFAKANGLELRGVVAVDGKALRGAFERGRQSTPLHMVNVWAAEARMCLAQRKAPGRNEAAGALEVLGLLDLEGCIVTADALHCHRDFATTVLERGADYVLALKENQSKLFAAAARRYARSGARSVAERREPVTHDRCEWRRATVLRDTTFAAVHKFPGVVALARITSRRRALGGRAEPSQVRYFLLSKYIPAKRLLHIVRSHWGIENQLHWVLDVVFNEDRNRTRKDNAPENLAILRKLALNLVRSHPAATSLRQKIKRAGWDDAFLLGMLSHMR